jgi:uncharacterized protein YqeY
MQTAPTAPIAAATFRSVPARDEDLVSIPVDASVAFPVTSLKERLSTEMRQALKSGDRVRLGALRLLAASVKNREVEVRHELTDDEFVEVATREVKRRQEAIDAYEGVGRADRAETERQEMDALREYVPAGLSDEEVEVLIAAAVAETGAGSPADLGRVMGLVMSRAKGRVDGRAVQAKVREVLSAAGDA